MSGQHRRDAPPPEFAPGRAAAWQRWLRTLRWGTLLWLGPLVVVGAAASIALASVLIPFRPFELTSYRISPDTVCPGDPVTALVTRDFVDDVSYFQLSESWVTVSGVPGYGPDRPVSTESAELPGPALNPRGGPQTVPSPLITEAPTMPGVYRVRVITQASGTRFGLVPAIGSDTFYSDNTITVAQCPPPAPENEEGQ